MRLALVISSMGPGGAERVMSILASAWSERGYDVSLYVLSGKGSHYALHSGVRLVELDLLPIGQGKIAALTDLVRRCRRLRMIWSRNRPDVVLSFLDQTNVVTLLSTAGLGIRTFVAEHTNPSLQPISRVWDVLRSLLYPMAYRVVCLTKAARAYFPARWEPWMAIVPNPVLSPTARKGAQSSSSRSRIISVGRLGPEKGFDHLLQAVARVFPDRPGWTLTILGEGTERARLERLRDREGLGIRIDLPGLVPDPGPELASSDFFVLSSRWEGFPMALCEAMAVGLPVIATAFPGVEDILTSEVDGLIVPLNDEDALAEAIRRMIDDPDLRRRLGDAAREVAGRFSLERILDRWDDLFEVPDRSQAYGP